MKSNQIKLFKQDRSYAPRHFLHIKKILNKYYSGILDITVLSLFIIGFEWAIGAWYGYPLGGDAYNSLTRLRFVLENFPNIDWSPAWSSGMPIFVWYQPLPYLIMAAIMKLTQWTPEFTLNVATMGSVVLSGIGIYGSTKDIGVNRSIAIACGVLAVTTPQFLSWHILAGMYSRILATPFLTLTIWFALRSCRQVNNDEDTRRSVLLTILFLSLTIQSHTLVGLISSATVALAALFTINSWKKKVTFTLKIAFSTFCLSAYFLLPFFYFRPYSNLISLQSIETLKIDLTNLFIPSEKGVSIGLSPFLLPLFIPLLAAYLQKNKLKNNVIKTILTLSSIPFLIVLYAIFVSIGGAATYFRPMEMTYFIPLLLSPAIGILLHSLLRDYKRRHLGGIVFVITILFWVSYQYPLNQHPFVVRQPGYGELLTARMLNGSDVYDYNHRFAPNSAGFAVWFNYKYPAIPQTKDYYAQGNLNPDFSYLYEISTLHIDGNEDQTEFLLDWWGVKWLVADSRWDRADKFLSSPNVYELLDVGMGGNLLGFEYKGVSPVLSASNSPTALFIGSAEAYNLFFQALSLSNCDTDSLILVRGEECVDSSHSSISNDFDVIILYGYDYGYQEDAYPRLREYVVDGGKLLLLTDLSKEASSDFLPEPSPIWSTRAMAFGRKWNFSYTLNQYTRGTNFSLFSPAVYANGEWGYSGTYNSSIKEGGETILLNYGNPIVVKKDFGKGNVIWCGLNLPLHTVSYGNREESKFLVRLITADISDGESIKPIFTSEQLNPENFEIDVHNSCRGVLFKECYFPNWRAYVIGRANTPLRIYRAGPNFMYVQMSESDEHQTIRFKYMKSSVEVLGDIMSVGSFISLLFSEWLRKLVSPLLGHTINA